MTIPDGRDQQIVDLLLAGRSFPEIAAALTLSQETVENRVARLRRLNYVHTTRELIVKLLRDRLDEAHRELALRAAELDQCRRDLAALDRRRHGPGRMTDA